jgi:hypothetical protein
LLAIRLVTIVRGMENDLLHIGVHVRAEVLGPR